jgi:hypothetical protein
MGEVVKLGGFKYIAPFSPQAWEIGSAVSAYAHRIFYGENTRLF